MLGAASSLRAVERGKRPPPPAIGASRRRAPQPSECGRGAARSERARVDSHDAAAARHGRPRPDGACRRDRRRRRRPTGRCRRACRRRRRARCRAARGWRERTRRRPARAGRARPALRAAARRVARRRRESGHARRRRRPPARATQRRSPARPAAATGAAARARARHASANSRSPPAAPCVSARSSRPAPISSQDGCDDDVATPHHARCRKARRRAARRVDRWPENRSTGAERPARRAAFIAAPSRRSRSCRAR